MTIGKRNSYLIHHGQNNECICIILFSTIKTKFVVFLNISHKYKFIEIDSILQYYYWDYYIIITQSNTLKIENYSCEKTTKLSKQFLTKNKLKTSIGFGFKIFFLPSISLIHVPNFRFYIFYFELLIKVLS